MITVEFQSGSGTSRIFFDRPGPVYIVMLYSRSSPLTGSFGDGMTIGYPINIQTYPIDIQTLIDYGNGGSDCVGTCVHTVGPNLVRQRQFHDAQST